MPGMGSTTALKNRKIWLDLLAKVNAKKAAGQAPAAAAPGDGVAAPAPATTPRATPFYNAQDQVAIGDLNFQTTTDLNAVDQQLKDLGINTVFNQGQIDTAAKRNTGATNDDSAGRGIFGSSIQQGALADIESNRVVQRNYLQDQLDAAKIAGEARKTAINKHATDIMGGLDTHAVDNAAAINNQIPGEAPAPAPAAAAPAAKDYTDKPGYDSKGNAGTWRVHTDGHKVFMASGVPAATAGRPQRTTGR